MKRLNRKSKKQLRNKSYNAPSPPRDLEGKTQKKKSKKFTFGISYNNNSRILRGTHKSRKTEHEEKKKNELKVATVSSNEWDRFVAYCSDFVTMRFSNSLSINVHWSNGEVIIPMYEDWMKFLKSYLILIQALNDRLQFIVKILHSSCLLQFEKGHENEVRRTSTNIENIYKNCIGRIEMDVKVFGESSVNLRNSIDTYHSNLLKRFYDNVSILSKRGRFMKKTMNYHILIFFHYYSSNYLTIMQKVAGNFRLMLSVVNEMKLFFKSFSLSSPTVDLNGNMNTFGNSRRNNSLTSIKQQEYVNQLECQLNELFKMHLQFYKSHNTLLESISTRNPHKNIERTWTEDMMNSNVLNCLSIIYNVLEIDRSDLLFTITIYLNLIKSITNHHTSIRPLKRYKQMQVKKLVQRLISRLMENNLKDLPLIESLRQRFRLKLHLMRSYFLKNLFHLNNIDEYLLYKIPLFLSYQTTICHHSFQEKNDVSSSSFNLFEEPFESLHHHQQIKSNYFSTTSSMTMTPLSSSTKVIKKGIQPIKKPSSIIDDGVDVEENDDNNNSMKDKLMKANKMDNEIIICNNNNLSSQLSYDLNDLKNLNDQIDYDDNNNNNNYNDILFQRSKIVIEEKQNDFDNCFLSYDNAFDISPVQPSKLSMKLQSIKNSKSQKEKTNIPSNVHKPLTNRNKVYKSSSNVEDKKTLNKEKVKSNSDESDRLVIIESDDVPMLPTATTRRIYPITRPKSGKRKEIICVASQTSISEMNKQFQLFRLD